MYFNTITSTILITATASVTPPIIYLPSLKFSMSMKVIDTMSKALAAKIPGEEEHCNNVAEYSRSIAQRMNLDKKSCDDAYKAGLLHEIGMIGIPDALINRVDLTDDEYEIFKTYVSKGIRLLICYRQMNHKELHKQSDITARIMTEVVLMRV
jgi:HD-GYP domain-containing protein (c-di-GMP phosphodiesterase class II)